MGEIQTTSTKRQSTITNRFILLVTDKNFANKFNK